MHRCQLYMFRTVTVHPQELLFRCCMCRLWYVVRTALSDMSCWYNVWGRTVKFEEEMSSTQTSVTPKNIRIRGKNPILQMRSNRILQKHAYHRLFMVKFPNKCAWKNWFNPGNKEAWSGTQAGPWPQKAQVLGCIDGAQEGGTVSVFGSTPQYSRMKYMPLALVKCRL